MYMLKYTIKRILLMLMVFLVITTMYFVLIKLLPSAPATMFGKDMELIEARRELLGYNEPILKQYKYYWFGRTSYTFYELDENGEKVIKKDENNKTVYEQVPRTDKDGNIMYYVDSDGNKLNIKNEVTTDPLEYIILTKDKVDPETGRKVPVYVTKTVYDKSKIPAGREYVKENVGGIIRGYFGISEAMYIGTDVWDIFMSKIPFTMAVNLYSIFISIPVGLTLGVIAALKKNKLTDHIISTGVMVFVSVPSFIYAFLVLYLLYFKLGWVEATMDATQGAWSWRGFTTMIPAILSMSFGSIAGFARYTRAELSEVLTNEFMLLARTKGLTKAQATLRHAMRNAGVVIFPMIMGEFIGILSGSLIIEQMFGIPGVGKLYINSVQAQPAPDYNIFMLLGTFYTFIGLAAGIVSDISYGIIDPRIRMGAR
ncbi:MAG: ABC transporter permease [Clostridia bacterium]|nr:ABC transporter permease [Clostridia bacterium]MBQ9706863.1 ABC transporter permease [Clostridia bacterium]